VYALKHALKGLKHAWKGYPMNIVMGRRSVTRPRWNGSRVLFETNVAGRPVPCAISRAALQELSCCRHIASGDMLRRFADGRDRIEEIATNVFAVKPESVTGTLHIWADDIINPPTAVAVAHSSR
jgi:hypothetical protein